MRALVFHTGAGWDAWFSLLYRFQLHFHNIIYADDTQLYVEFYLGQPMHITTATDHHISPCAADVNSWMAPQNLILNESETEFVDISAVHNHKHVQPLSSGLAIDIRGCDVMSLGHRCYY